MVKVFRNRVNANLASGVRKSFSEAPLLFLAFAKSGFLDLANFSRFLAFDRFLIFPPKLPALPASLISQTPPLLTPSPVKFIASLEPLVGGEADGLVFSIEVSGQAILLKFLMKLL